MKKCEEYFHKKSKFVFDRAPLPALWRRIAAAGLIRILMLLALAIAVSKAGAAVVYTTLHSFQVATNGSNPTSSLVLGSDGNFYGTTSSGGTKGGGTVFRITATGEFTLLYSFTGGSDGASPNGLVQGGDGNFYGTTYSGAILNPIFDSGNGTVFKITPNGKLTTLYSFTSEYGDFSPEAGLVYGNDGNFYGTTSAGGGFQGSVFKISPGGAYTNLYSFSGSDGQWPEAGLVEGSDGNFYGTTSSGGAYNYGVVFKISASGAFTPLYSFAGGNDGAYPEAGLVQGSDANFYGTTITDGAHGNGAIFRITPGGVFTNLYSFTTGYPYSYYTDGAQAGLVQGSDGNFYGATYGGGRAGPNGVGTIFRITPGGVFTSLYSFTGSNDGAYPLAALVQGSDGDFYGTTSSGGVGGRGVVFRLSVGLAPVATIVTSSSSFGVKNQQFGFDITGTTGAVAIVQAATNVANPIWIPVSTNILAGGVSHFSDSLWTNYPNRLYRMLIP